MSNVVSLWRGIAPISMFEESSLKEVEQMMNRLAQGGRIEQAGLMVQEHLATGGKRLRARLALSATTALGARRESAIGWAAAVELLHNATLIHDDIQDQDRMRRGKPTTWAVHGQAQAINAGDLMLMLPFLALSNTMVSDQIRWQLSWRLADQAAKTVRGQVEEIDVLHKKQLSDEGYFRFIQGKTGGFFALPVEGAALIAGLALDDACKIGAAFEPLGVLFQLQDDILDLYGEKGRESIGADIREGKPSILVLRYLELKPEDSDWLWSILKRSREETTQEDVDLVIERFRNSGALDKALADIERYRAKIQSCNILRQYQYLHKIACELTELSLKPIRHLL